MSTFTIGVDVSKAKFDVCLLNEDLKPHYISFTNDAKGIKDFLAALNPLAIARSGSPCTYTQKCCVC